MVLSPNRYAIQLSEEVASARAQGRPIVALESTIISHGLPRPDNLRVARDIEKAVRAEGAVPATIGMVDGRILVGLDDSQLERLATGHAVAKLSVRDLPVAAAARVDGATTVASTSAIADAAGIRVFATGGLGGVHRVVGYGTKRFPGFFISDSGYDLDWSIDSPEQAAEILTAHSTQGVGGGAVIVASPLPPDEQLDPSLHDATLAAGLAMLERDGVTGKAVTPFLLAHFHTATHGLSLAVNVRIILRNAALAAQIAAASARVSRSDAPVRPA